MNAVAPLLRVAGLNAGYGRAQVLFGVTLELQRGEVVALMGRNGAGKSTTQKAIAGLLDNTGGEIIFDGRSLRGLPSFRIARLGLGYVPEERRIFTELTVRENLEVGRLPRRDDAPYWDEARVYELFPTLAAMPDRLGGRMSGGEQQMLTVARSLMGNPRLLLLDEPSEGIAPKIVEQMAHAVQALKREGLSVLLSEQNFAFANFVADRAYVLDKGQVCYQGELAQLLVQPDLRREYLAL
jgi:branched-chain amino acid transport system ATP-binding protein